MKKTAKPKIPASLEVVEVIAATLSGGVGVDAPPNAPGANGEQMGPWMIHGDDLADKVHLTFRQLREIAKTTSLYPQPVKGHFWEKETLYGLIDYYRDLWQKQLRALSPLQQEKLRGAKIDNDKKAGLLADIGILSESLQGSLGPLRDELRHQLENTLPLSMSGMGVPENRIVGRQVADAMFEQFQSIFGKFKL